MSNNDNSSLLGFLQKKSLFSNSPNKASRRRSRSKSRDSKNIDQRSNFNTFDEKMLEDPLQQSRKPQPQDNVRKLQGNDSRVYIPSNQNNLRFQFNTNEQKVLQNNIEPEPITNRSIEERIAANNRMTQEKYQVSNNNIWTGLVSYNNSFQSARIQSAQCLQNLSIKVGTEIVNINYKIEAFNSKMARILTSQFRNVRERINQIMDAAFKQSQKYVKEYMRQKQQQLAGEIIKMKEFLEKEQIRIEGMKDQLTKPQWRKTAGQILSSDLQSKIEEVIKKSSSLQVGAWELQDIGSFRVKNIQNEMKELLRIKI